MYYLLLLILCFGTVINAGEKCQSSCPPSSVPVCGKDGKNYNSYCNLRRQECIQESVIGFDCNGECPCDPKEVINLDVGTVKKLQNLRTEVQLEKHENEDKTEEKFLEILDDKDIVEDRKEVENLEKELLKEQEITLTSEKYFKQGSGDCPTEEMSELPSRLIDWFHVLKTNEQQQQMKDQGIEQEPILKELKFRDAKLKSIYAALACTPQDDDDIEKQVCLTPVQWMFHHLDANKDSFLSAVELYEINQINKEHCIKPFLRDCDANKDGKVELKEFCRCLCLTPPCTKVLQSIPTILLSGEPRPIPGIFTPVCDEDGFFMPRQCNEKHAECWCVDRNGAEHKGTRTTGNVHCNLNTKREFSDGNLIPLDLSKENA